MVLTNTLIDMNTSHLFHRWKKPHYINYINNILNVLRNKGHYRLFNHFKYNKLPFVVFRDHSYMYNLKLRDDFVYIRKEDISLNKNMIVVEDKLCHYTLLEPFFEELKKERNYKYYY